jgi:transposase
MWFREHARVFLAPGITDMRKAINGLSIMVEAELERNLFSGDLFVFCNRHQSIIKILYWYDNGFCLWQKRLEKHRFIWPSTEKEVAEIGIKELEWLLSGLDIHQAHEKLEYEFCI